jgi:predicted nucleotidyltransferase
MSGISKALADLCRDYGLQALYVFGSRGEEMRAVTRGEEPTAVKRSSDVDIGVLPRRGHRLDARSKVRLVAALEDLLEAPRVDLVVLPEAGAFLALEVVRGELLVDLSPDETARYELYVLRRAADLLPYEQQRRAAILTGSAR